MTDQYRNPFATAEPPIADFPLPFFSNSRYASAIFLGTDNRIDPTNAARVRPIYCVTRSARGEGRRESGAIRSISSDYWNAAERFTSDALAKIFTATRFRFDVRNCCQRGLRQTVSQIPRITGNKVYHHRPHRPLRSRRNRKSLVGRVAVGDHNSIYNRYDRCIAIVSRETEELAALYRGLFISGEVFGALWNRINR